ncbi:FAD-binding oxidoreductase [Agromyces sp. SYSU T0242]|uniref:FAD-binding oxidoreductase n=1 Tax=Agromyces litoreus TaxID=3158561 RepID=UPI0033926C26
MSFVTELSGRMPGLVHEPGTAGYEAGARVFAGEGTPDAVVRPTSAAEVAEAVRAAVAAGVPIAVRSGGHGSDPVGGGLVIDLGALSAVELETDGAADGPRLVHVGPGAQWGDVAAALTPHGLAVSSGDTIDVGVGGLALGGGLGWFARSQGLTVDLVRAIELVTATGDVLSVDASSHPELFWALRGGGGNFGVATRFTFEARPLGALTGGHVQFDRSDARAVLGAFRDVFRDAPDQLNATLLVMPPLMPELPAGPQLAVALEGDEAELRRLLEPMLSLPSVTEVALGPVAYADLLEESPPGTPPFVMVGANGFVPELSDAALDAFARALDADEPVMLLLRALGGAFSRVPADATAIAQRDGLALVAVTTLLPADAAADEVSAAREAAAETASFTTGRYANFTPEFGADILAEIFPPATLDRLRAVKREVDPEDVFRPSHHVTP